LELIIIVELMAVGYPSITITIASLIIVIIIKAVTFTIMAMNSYCLNCRQASPLSIIATSINNNYTSDWNIMIAIANALATVNIHIMAIH